MKYCPSAVYIFLSKGQTILYLVRNVWYLVMQFGIFGKASLYCTSKPTSVDLCRPLQTEPSGWHYMRKDCSESSPMFTQQWPQPEATVKLLGPWPRQPGPRHLPAVQFPCPMTLLLGALWWQSHLQAVFSLPTNKSRPRKYDFGINRQPLRTFHCFSDFWIKTVKNMRARVALG